MRLMERSRWLAVTSAVQLTSDLAGFVIADRRRLPADPVGVHLHVPRTHMVRNSALLGTGQSAPIVMLAAQVWATGRLLRGPDETARKTLGALGMAMVGGYLVERGSPLWPGHRERWATTAFAVGLAGSAAMAALARR